ncbi:MAG: hypothetical protein V4666_07875 [Bacteroidota bacterium]
MSRLNLMLVMLIFVPNFMFSQEVKDFTIVKTATNDVKVPGNWEQLNTADDSGQTYLKSSDGVIIAIAQNQKRAYPCFNSKKSDFENVKLFYIWDSDYRKENKFATDKVKENAKLEFVIWKYNDGKLDNVFLFGSVKDNFLNLLVYTDKWSEAEKVTFLENLYKINK